MRKYKEFPYPSKDELIVAYGRKGCPYCEKLKLFFKKISGLKNYKIIYHDIFEIIDSGKAKDISDFKKKMRLFIDDYSMVPIVFIEGKFIGGYTNFCDFLHSLVQEHRSKRGVKELRELIDEMLINDNINLIKKKLEKNKCERIRIINKENKKSK